MTSNNHHLIAVYAPSYDANDFYGRIALEMVWHFNQMNIALGELLELEKQTLPDLQALVGKELTLEQREHMRNLAQATHKAKGLAASRKRIRVAARGANVADFTHTFNPVIASLMEQKADGEPDALVLLGTPTAIAGYDVRGLVAYTSITPGQTLAANEIDVLTKCRTVLVPATWQVERLRKFGVRTQIEVLRPGISENFVYVERSKFPQEFVWLADESHTLAYKAFKEAFGNSTKHRLLMINGSDAVKGGNVDVIRRPTNEKEWQLLFAVVHGVVYPSSGDDFGWLPRAAARTGLPVIATDAFGTADDLVAWGFTLPAKTRKDEAQPDFARLKYLLEYISGEKRFKLWHQIPANRQSERTALRVGKLYDWETFSGAVFDMIYNAAQRGIRLTVTERKAKRKAKHGNGGTENTVSA